MEDNKDIGPEQPAKNIPAAGPGGQEILPADPQDSANETSMPEAEAATAEQPKTQNTEPQTKNMETHAQHLHHAPGKKFRHYLYEFLMLFFAVFCGFLAENWREHYIEGKKEKQFIHSIREDLNSDIYMLDSILKTRKEMKIMIDSLLYFMNYTDPRQHGNEIYYYTRRAPRTYRFYTNDRTLTQLKNAGNWRLIQNKNVSERLSTYDNLVSTLAVYIEHREESVILILYQSINKLFDNKVFDEMLSGLDFTRPQNNPQLLSYDKAALNEFCNQMHFRKNTNMYFINVAEKLLAEARLTLDIINKEYHLK